MPHVLRPQHPGEQHRAERGREQQRDRRGAGERRAAGTAPRSISGLRCRAVWSGEQRQRQPPPPSERTSVRASPQPHVPPLTRPSTSAPTPPVISSAPSGVRHGHGMAGHVRQPPPADGQREQPDRHVDEEHPAPARRHEQSADHRAERGRQAADRGPGADRARDRRSGARSRGSGRARSASAAPRRPPARPGTRPASAGWSRRRTPPRRRRTRPRRAGSRARAGSARPAARTAPATPRRRSRRRSAPTRGPPRRRRADGSPAPICGSATLTMNRSRLASTTPAHTIASTQPAARRPAPPARAGRTRLA